MIAKIAVGAAVYAIDRPYSYRIPPELSIQPGMRVMVPFGAGNRRTEGIVLAVDAEQDVDRLKCVDRVLDQEPVLDENALRMAAFVRERYFCTFYDAIKAMLPAGLWFRGVNRFTICGEADWRAAIKRQPLAVQIMELMEALGGAVDYAYLLRQFPEEEGLQAALRYLQKKKLIAAQSDLLRRIGDKTEYIVSLAAPVEEAMEYAAKKRRSAPMQAAVLELLCTIGSGSSKEIRYFTGCTTAVLRRLCQLGFAEISSEPVLRRIETHPASSVPSELSPEQLQVYHGLCRQWQQERPGVALLYGVTGSGKTAVYLRLIHRCLDEQRTALMLVPEIALTPQLLSVFSACFGQQVAVLHSGLRVGERYDEWKRICSGEAKVVIGTRSAVFAPLRNLGILIVDEEQEHTYKSENSPRYHAREVALYRGLRERALVILGSATPSVETMYHAQKGDYRLYRMEHRYNGRELPQVEIADLKEEIRKGNGTAISAMLRDEICRNLKAGQQTILFLNRRGASRCMVCVDCGTVPQCPRCSVHLTYHKVNRRLMCHYCGHSEPLPDRCPICGGHLKPVGVGTQKVVEELEYLFPGVRILRMDADTVSAVNSHEKLLEQFQTEKIPILVGTQMVAKGLNFDNVTLVGVLDADMSLYVDNFRAGETTFSMLTQVVGRSGRGRTSGRAVIQTMTPENAVIALASRQDYDGFYEMELQLRRLRSCPPFMDLFVVFFSGPFEERVQAGAEQFRQMLGWMLMQEAYRTLQMTVLGPAPAAVAKVNNRYRYRLTLSCTNTRPVRQLIAYLLQEFAKDRRFRGVTAFADVNPYD